MDFVTGMAGNMLGDGKKGEGNMLGNGKKGEGNMLDNVKDKIIETLMTNKDDIIKAACTNLGLSAEQGQMMKKVFEMFDNGNGKVKKEELGDVIRTMGKNPTDDEIKEIEKELKVDNDGNIDFSDFVEVVGKKFVNEEDKEKTLREAFKVFDKDSNGFLTIDELRDIMTNKGKMKLSEAEVEEMIAEVDKDADGKLNYEEFIVLFSQ